jgi:predicted Zn-dependent peptidase
VPVFWAEVPGPLRAMLIFRVGVVDETLHTHGITHLVEHLVMAPLVGGGEAPRPRVNASVDSHTTRFMAMGSADEVADFISSVCSSLSELSTDHLDHEKRVLATEEANSNYGTRKSIWLWRFGASGLGLGDYPELGLRWLGAESVTEWAHSYFTADNAAVWISGAIPDGLALALPRGERKPIPRVRHLPRDTPALYREGDRWVLLSLVGDRAPAMSLATEVLASRLMAVLRHRESLAYETKANYVRLDPFTAEVSAFADTLAANAGQAAQIMVEEVRRLSEEAPSPDELAPILTEWRSTQQSDESGLRRLERAAIAELEDLGAQTADEIEAKIEALRPEELTQAIADALPSAYLAIPHGVRDAFPGFTPIPAGNGERIRGKQFNPAPGFFEVINYSDDGISLQGKGENVVVFRWEEVAAACWWSDGRRLITGLNGLSLGILPSMWTNAPALLEVLRVHVPPDRWVPMDDAEPAPEQQLACSICYATPAMEATFRDPLSFFWIFFFQVRGVYCSDCGVATFRRVQRRVLLRGWWSLPGLIVTPIALIHNFSVCSALTDLGTPTRTSGIAPIDKGRPVWMFPGVAVPIALVGGLLLLIAHPWG